MLLRRFGFTTRECKRIVCFKLFHRLAWEMSLIASWVFDASIATNLLICSSWGTDWTQSLEEFQACFIEGTCSKCIITTFCRIQFKTLRFTAAYSEANSFTPFTGSGNRLGLKLNFDFVCLRMPIQSWNLVIPIKERAMRIFNQCSHHKELDIRCPCVDTSTWGGWLVRYCKPHGRKKLRCFIHLNGCLSQSLAAYLLNLLTLLFLKVAGLLKKFQSYPS